MMKPVMPLCIKDLDSLKLIFTERKYHVLKIICRDWHIELPKSFNADQIMTMSFPLEVSDYLENVLFGKITIS